MGRKAISGGVTNFRGKCRVDFKYEGQRYQPVLDLEYNARNVRATQKMMETVRAKIEHGVFDPAAYFPDYAGLKRMAVATTSASAKTFADYAELRQASLARKLLPRVRTTARFSIAYGCRRFAIGRSRRYATAICWPSCPTIQR